MVRSLPCSRKVAIVGLPVFFNPPGSDEQLVFGLLLSYISTVLFNWFKPFKKKADDVLSVVAQISLFSLLVSAIIVRLETDSKALEVALFFLLLVPPGLALVPEGALKKIFKEKTPKQIREHVLAADETEPMLKQRPGAAAAASQHAGGSQEDMVVHEF